MQAMQIVSIRPQGWVYADSWREAAEALHYGLAEIGIDAPLRENAFAPAATPIVFGAHHLSDSGKRKLPADSILYNFEQFQEGYPWFTPEYLALLRRFRVWDFSARNIEFLRRSNAVTQATHVPIGYVPQWSRIETAQQDVDVLFFGRTTQRRKRVLDEFGQHGFKVQFLDGVFGQERDRWIGRSKLVLNIHADYGGLFEHLRVLYLLANNKAVVTEPGEAGEIDPELMSGMEVAPYEKLVQSCVRLLRDDAARRALADAGLRAVADSGRRMSAILRKLPEFRNRDAGAL